MPFPLDSDDMEQTPSQTGDAGESRSHRRPDDRALGKTEELDEKSAGDIADEGQGRRG